MPKPVPTSAKTFRVASFDGIERSTSPLRGSLDSLPGGQCLLLRCFSFFLLASLLIPTSPSSAATPRMTIRLEHDDYSGAEPRDAVATTVAVSSNGKRIAAAGDDHRLRIWDSSTGDPVERLDAHHTDWIRGIQFSPKDDLIASVGADRRLRLHSLLKPLSESYAKIAGKESDIILDSKSALQSLAFHPTEPLIATVGFSDSLKIYNLETGEETQSLTCPCEDIRTVCFSKDGRWLAAAGRDGTVRLWDQLSDSNQQDLPSDGRRIRAIAFSPDSKQLAAAGDGPAIRVWQFDENIIAFRSGARQGSFNPVAQEILTRPGKNHSMAFVDDETLAVGGTTGEIRLWNVISRSQADTLTGHTGTIAAIATSADGKMLVSGSFDATVRVWDLGEKNRVAAKNSSEATR